jgi:hypothetical protein
MFEASERYREEELLDFINKFSKEKVKKVTKN